MRQFINRKIEDELDFADSDDGDCTSSDSEDNLDDKELAKIFPNINRSNKIKRKNKYSSTRSHRQKSNKPNSSNKMISLSLKTVS